MERGEVRWKAVPLLLPRQGEHEHPIGRTMIEQRVSKIFLANPEAQREEYVEGFGLSQAEF
jgi:type IV secretory pathway VirB4 component